MPRPTSSPRSTRSRPRPSRRTSRPPRPTADRSSTRPQTAPTSGSRPASSGVANLFALTIPDSAAALLVTYGAGALIRVQSSPTEAGSYGDVVTIPIVSGVATYPVYDPTGEAGYSYKYRYEEADG